MKKVCAVSGIFLIICFAATLVYEVVFTPVPELIERTVKAYRFSSVLFTFFSILPASLSAGAVIGWALALGDGSRKILTRFSPAMFAKFRSVMISSLIFVFLMTAALEIGAPLAGKRMAYYERLPDLKREYMRIAESLCGSGEFSDAYEFASLAVKTDPTDADALELQRRTELAANSAAGETAEASGGAAEQDAGAQNAGERQNADANARQNAGAAAQNADEHSADEVYALLQNARRCMAAKDWFGAHYSAQTALQIAPARNINIGELKNIAAEAWNRLSETAVAERSEEQKIFVRKYEGYRALMTGDDMRAYYIFKALSLQSRELALDPDVVRYLGIAEKRLETKYFFIDETFNLQEFEEANDVCFKVRRRNGSTDVFFIKGVTPVRGLSDSVQYLRGLSVFTVSTQGEYVSGYYVPYAKMTAVSADFFDVFTRSALEMDDSWDSVPCVMLCSVDRRHEGVVNRPVTLLGDGASAKESYILLPMSCGDFELLEEASNGADMMNVVSLFHFADRAERYGYSGEVFSQALLNRMLYPLFMLCLMLWFAGFSWNGRLESGSVFKFKWLAAFPIFALFFFEFYKVALSLFKMINFSLLGLAGQTYAFLLGLIIYLALLILISVRFLGKRVTQPQPDDED